MKWCIEKTRLEGYMGKGGENTFNIFKPCLYIYVPIPTFYTLYMSYASKGYTFEMFIGAIAKVELLSYVYPFYFAFEYMQCKCVVQQAVCA